MSRLGLVEYVTILLGSSVLTMALVPLALRVAVRLDVVDRPGGYKQHGSPIPYLGGVAIALGFSAAVIVAALIRPPSAGLTELLVIMGAAAGLSLVGLVDDLRGLGLTIRLLAAIAAALALWFAGVQVQLFDVPVADAVLTVLWVVGITNAFNLLDNMDGLSAGVAAIACVSLFAIAALNGQFLVAALSIALLGCAIAFLRHNFHPATIYMGDAGSLFLGFMLAVLGIKLRFDAPREITFLVPVLVLGVAIFDTVLVVTTRLVHRRNPFRGHRDHTSHRLVFVGIPVPASVALIYGAGFALGWTGLVVSRLDVVTTAYLLAGLVVALGLFGGTLLALVPVYENSRRRRVMIREVTEHEAEPVAEETGRDRTVVRAPPP